MGIPRRRGRLLCYTERLEVAGGGNEVKPYTWCVTDTGAKRWARKALPTPHPLYGLDRLAKHPDPPVIVTEGENKADTGERSPTSTASRKSSNSAARCAGAKRSAATCSRAG